jgi:lipopolysaccharide export system permease protein
VESGLPGLINPGYTRRVLRARRLPFYLLREFVPLYVLGIGTLLVLLTIDFFATLIALFLNRQTSLALVFQTWADRLPFFVSYILAPALAFAILVGLGRLAKDSEIKAAFATGVPPLALVVPALGFGVLIVIVGFLNSNFLQPQADARFLDSLYRVAGSPGAPRTQNLKSFANPDGSVLYHAGTLTPRIETPEIADLSGVMIVTREGTYTAPRGSWDATTKTWVLENTYFMPDKVGNSVEVRSEGRKVFPFTLEIEPDSRPPEHLPLPELIERSNNLALTPQDRYEASFKLHRRFSDPLAALVMAMIGAAIGVSVANRAWAFAGVILTIACYWVLWIFGQNLASSQAVPVLIAAWLPTAVFAVAGVIALRRLT